MQWIEISQTALFHNLNSIRQVISPLTKIMAMVKANAYGHGLDLVAPTIASRVDFFGVNTMAEAKVLRHLNLTNPILITGPVASSDLAQAVKLNISLCAHSLEYLKQLSGLKLNIHLKINTGMNRLGIFPTEVSTALEILAQSKLTLEGVYTHFHSADFASSTTITQLYLFKACVKQVKTRYPAALAHCANTAATLTVADSHLDMIRPGICLYGLWPSDYVRRHSRVLLLPVLTWQTRPVQIREIPAGQTIGYGATYKFPKSTWTATLPVGYSDGLDRKLSNQDHFVGRISMNFSTIKISSTIKPHSPMELIGPHHTVEHWAKLLGTINYEVVTRLNPLIPRILV
ncbi:MAG: alanine racemase [bacterium]|nr:alanine racemase [bacterium]